MEPRYYGFLFKTSQWADEFYAWGHGIVADLWTTGWNEMKKIALPQPPLDEQRRIADYLDARCADIDAAIGAAEKSIDEYKTYRQAIIYEAITGKVGNNDLVASGISWIALLPRNWSVVSVGDLFSCRAEKVSDEDYPPVVGH